MKIRLGFVSNSSSSSYICEVCDDITAGENIDFSDYEIHQCVVGHVCCDNHGTEPKFDRELLLKLLNDTKIMRQGAGWLKESDPARYAEGIASVQKDLDEVFTVSDDEFDNLAETIVEAYEYSNRYELPKAFCLICNMERIGSDDMFAYLLKKSGMCKTVVEDTIKKEFADYEAFKAFLK